MTPTTDGRHDIAIVGDGVAALAAARALQQGGCQPIRIAPSRPRSGNRGELLGGRALASLERLAWGHLLDDRRLSLPAESRYSAWGSPALVTAPVDPAIGSGWYVDRGALEAAMRADACPEHRIEAAVTGVGRDGDAWALALSTGEMVSARFVIDSSGRAGAIARRLGGLRRRQGGLVAMHRTLPMLGAAVVAASLIESAPDGWWYSAPVPGGESLFVAYFTDAELLPRDVRHEPALLGDLLATVPLTRSRLESLDVAIPDTSWRIDVAATTLQERVAGAGWAAAGDAAVALDPLAGHGLTVALWAGIQTALAARAWLDGDADPLETYRQAVDTGRHRFVADAGRHYRAERRFRDRPFWSRRHSPTE